MTASKNRAKPHCGVSFVLGGLQRMQNPLRDATRSCHYAHLALRARGRAAIALQSATHARSVPTRPPARGVPDPGSRPVTQRVAPGGGDPYHRDDAHALPSPFRPPATKGLASIGTLASLPRLVSDTSYGPRPFVRSIGHPTPGSQSPTTPPAPLGSHLTRVGRIRPGDSLGMAHGRDRRGPDRRSLAPDRLPTVPGPP